MASPGCREINDYMSGSRFSPSEHSGQPEGHFGQKAHCAGVGGIGNGQAQRLEALAQNDSFGVGWIFRGDGVVG
jgi:hypothetical protein